MGTFTSSNRSLRIALVTAIACTCCLPTAAFADGLSDLKAALAKMQGQTGFRAVVEAKTWRRLGEGAEAQERAGSASVNVEESGNGLQVLYSKELMARIEQEEKAKAKDPNSKTPSLAATIAFDASQLRTMTNAASAISHNIEKAQYRGERIDSYNGKPARLLTFDLGQDTLSERERKYVKKFEGTLQVWIGADGVPLASRSYTNASGRAFIVITFEAKSEEQQVYALLGDRLLMTQKESKNSAAGAGERSEERVVKSLQVQ